MALTRLGGIEPQSHLRLPVICNRLKAITFVYLPTATLMLLSSLITTIKLKSLKTFSFTPFYDSHTMVEIRACNRVLLYLGQYCLPRPGPSGGDLSNH